MTRVPIVVLGAGPAGLAAADAASADGHPVLVVDDNATPGGQIWRGGHGAWRDARAAGLWARLSARSHVAWMQGARVVARRHDGSLLVERAGDSATVPCESAIVCSGAREMMLPFPGWTLPGVAGAGGLQALAKGGMPLAGKRVVVAGSGPLLLAAAHSLRRHGAHIVAIAEHRGTADLARFAARLAGGHRAKLIQAAMLFARLAGVPYLRGATVTKAQGIERLASVTLSHKGREQTIDCDFLASGYGLVPAPESAALFGCAIEGGKVVVDHHQLTSIAGVWAAGEVTGIGGVDKALAEGRIAGLAAAGRLPSSRERRGVAQARSFAGLLADHFGPTAALRDLCQPETIVCRCEDVRAVELAPWPDWRSAKLQTRAGMGPCQGRVCASACAFLFGWEPPASCAAPVFPVSAAALATLASGPAAGEIKPG